MPPTTPIGRHIARLNKREGNIGGDADFIQTPRIATTKLLEEVEFSKSIWEPTCGEGAISRVLQEFGHKVINTDLIYRGFGNKNPVDFLTSTYRCNNIVTNPPYSLMVEFIEHALTLVDEKLALLLPLMALGSSQRRSRVFYNTNPSKILCFKKKIPYVNHLGDEKASSFPHMWVVWEVKRLTKLTVVKWI